MSELTKGSRPKEHGNPSGKDPKGKERKPTPFERRVEARVLERVQARQQELAAEAEAQLDDAALTEPASLARPAAHSPAEGGNEDPLAEARRIAARVDPEVLAAMKHGANGGQQEELLQAAALIEQVLRRQGKPAPRASTVIQPSGGGLPAPDLRAEYEKRLRTLRPGDVAGLMELKREFRKKGAGSLLNRTICHSERSEESLWRLVF